MTKTSSYREIKLEPRPGTPLHRILQLQQRIDELTCSWEYCENIQNFEDVWDTGCGQQFTLVDSGTPSEYNMVYCPMCGKPIEEK